MDSWCCIPIQMPLPIFGRSKPSHRMIHACTSCSVSLLFSSAQQGHVFIGVLLLYSAAGLGVGSMLGFAFVKCDLLVTVCALVEWE